jgi:hypothetical protein
MPPSLYSTDMVWTRPRYLRGCARAGGHTDRQTGRHDDIQRDRERCRCQCWCYVVTPERVGQCIVTRNTPVMLQADSYLGICCIWVIPNRTPPSPPSRSRLSLTPLLCRTATHYLYTCIAIRTELESASLGLHPYPRTSNLIPLPLGVRLDHCLRSVHRV